MSLFVFNSPLLFILRIFIWCYFIRVYSFHHSHTDSRLYVESNNLCSYIILCDFVMLNKYTHTEAKNPSKLLNWWNSFLVLSDFFFISNCNLTNEKNWNCWKNYLFHLVSYSDNQKAKNPISIQIIRTTSIPFSIPIFFSECKTIKQTHQFQQSSGKKFLSASKFVSIVYLSNVHCFHIVMWYVIVWAW